jgi:RecB family exonuclease
MSKPMAMSYSRLSTFEQCPAKFDYLYVTKLARDAGSEASEYGNRVHEVLENYGKDELDLDSLGLEGKQTLKRWGSVVDSIKNKSGNKYYEFNMAVDKNNSPVDWFDSSVFIRSIADVLVVDGSVAYCLDFKTGKVRENPTQLQLFAAMVFWHFPEVETVKTSFIWLKFDEITNATYQRRYLSALWEGLKPRFDKVQETIDLGVFDTKPSGLCPWCPARSMCPDARGGRR